MANPTAWPAPRYLTCSAGDRPPNVESQPPDLLAEAPGGRRVSQHTAKVCLDVT